MFIGNYSFREKLSSSLFSAFEKNRKAPPSSGDNDNRAPFPVGQVFTEEELSRVRDMIRPYIKAGLITDIEFRLGQGFTVMLALDQSKKYKQNNVVFNLNKTVHHDYPPEYCLSFGGVKARTDTINFADILSAGKVQLSRLCPLSTPAHLSPVP